MNHVDRASDLSARWRTSSRSQQGAQCVEVATAPEWTAIRDSKNPNGPALRFLPHQFANMLNAAKTDRLG
ncbi:DUF397 domain-containing protein [Umezawaea sp. Da 62-37]|uniref:DUF397 domain-containing protein n=1 Tax=Umezawaea sp. Da 62-37 TaxID=3075927 RepID=UPI0028F6E9C4|nr:DUF397 domain-containing protein [Umezawaea sp. Da 62-37]WNV86599.1 DUF397 domain-containing protein [Umezawaea sp. Da 62-37]